jgi:hypothetical protein
MAFYVVSYDLHNTRDYQPVWDYLEGVGAEKLLESLWVVSFNGGAPQLRDALKATMDEDDSCAVLELRAGSGWAASRAKKEGVQWLRGNILA